MNNIHIYNLHIPCNTDKPNIGDHCLSQRCLDSRFHWLIQKWVKVLYFTI